LHSQNIPETTTGSAAVFSRQGVHNTDMIPRPHIYPNPLLSGSCFAMS
jgi:hypothetical protein